MPSTTSLLAKLQHDFPDIAWEPSDTYRWDFQARTIFYDQQNPSADYLLHELGHAMLDHRDYTRSIQLIGMERDAWAQARTVLAPRYSVTVDADIEEVALDSYRDWIHSRSLCPACNSNGVEVAQKQFRCIACEATWTVNDARSCRLQRVIIKKAP